MFSWERTRAILSFPLHCVSQVTHLGTDPSKYTCMMKGMTGPGRKPKFASPAVQTGQGIWTPGNLFRSSLLRSTGSIMPKRPLHIVSSPPPFTPFTPQAKPSRISTRHFTLPRDLARIFSPPLEKSFPRGPVPSRGHSSGPEGPHDGVKYVMTDTSGELSSSVNQLS